MSSEAGPSPFISGTNIQWACKLIQLGVSSALQKRLRIITLTEDGCWNTGLKTNKKGYICFNPAGRQGGKVRLHRYIWETVFGKLNPEQLVLHTCHNRWCCNLDHLYIGSAAANTSDMMQSGRGFNGQSSYGFHGWTNEIKRKRISSGSRYKKAIDIDLEGL